MPGIESPSARPSYQPDRRQHRRDPTPADGLRSRLPPGLHAAGASRRGRAAERHAGRSRPAVYRRPAARRRAFGCASRPRAIVSRSTRFFSPQRSRPRRISGARCRLRRRRSELCLAVRVPACRVVGLERSAILSGSPATMSILNGLERASFGHDRRSVATAAAALAGHRSTMSWRTRPFMSVRRARRRRAQPSARGDGRGRGRSWRLGAVLAGDGARQRARSRLFIAPTGSMRSSANSPAAPARSSSFRCGRAGGSRRAAFWCAHANRLRHRRGCCHGSGSAPSPTAGFTEAAEGVLRDGKGLDL